MGNKASIPITKNPDQDLSDNYTDNLHVVNRINPYGVTYFGIFPATCKHSLEHGFDIADREENVTIGMSEVSSVVLTQPLCLPFKTKTGAGNDHVPNVIPKRLQGISLEHGPDVTQLSSRLFPIVGGDEADALHDGQVSPVNTIHIVAVVGFDEVVEDLPLIVGHGVDWVVSTVHVGSMRGGWTIVLYVSHDGCTSVLITGTSQWQGGSNVDVG